MILVYKVKGKTILKEVKLKSLNLFVIVMKGPKAKSFSMLKLIKPKAITG